MSKTKRKLTLRPKQKKTWSQWATEKHASFVDDQMKSIFSDESRICIGEYDDAGAIV